MKKILIINGSPNEKGHTRKIIDNIFTGLNMEVVEIDEINCYQK